MSTNVAPANVPAATHPRADQQDTLIRRLSFAPVGSAVAWVFHAWPFHLSASVR